MRLIAATLICLAAPVSAEGWQIMYLADSGGSRPMRVGPDEGGIAMAYVDNDRGERLLLDCHSAGRPADDFNWTLEIFPGTTPTFLSRESTGNQFILTFDGTDAKYHIGDFTFVQEAFWAPVNEFLAADIQERRVIRLEMPGEFVEGGKTYRTEFTLSGSQAAIDKACPAL